MITLTVTSFKGNPVGNPPVSFDELGGTIGRADTNQMVLPDPERAISRIHAQVVFRGGSYALVGRGANAVLHNGAPVGHGAEVLLAQGDKIVIGSYHIAVSTGAAVAATDPFEAAFGNGNKAAPAPPPLPASPPRPTTLPEDRTGPRAAAPSASSGKSSGFGIPDDWDPFAKDHAGAAAADPFGEILGASNPARQPASSVGGKGVPPVTMPAREDSIDALFGLKAGAPSGDPFGSASPLGSAPAQPNTGGSADPLRSLLQTPLPVAKVESDHVSDLNAPWVNARPAAKPPAAPLPGAVLSWDVSSRAVKIGGQPPPPAAPFIPAATTILGPSSAPAAIPAAVPVPPAPAPAPRPVAAQRPVVAAAPDLPPVAASAGALSSGDAALLDALREGLGTPDLRIAALSPELMRQLGELLRESTKGTVELLAARAALKREVRADVTTILASANNSLKFSPSVEVALQYLLGPRMMGFMPPVESMRDAYDDLKAHQLGVMAGMKAALAGVLERFDPKVVEAKLTGGSALSALLPSSRKARLWELFQELYQKLAVEAEEDFNTLFGAAFLKAYQQYIDQLEGRETRK